MYDPHRGLHVLERTRCLVLYQGCSNRPHRTRYTGVARTYHLRLTYEFGRNPRNTADGIYARDLVLGQELKMVHNDKDRF